MKKKYLLIHILFLLQITLFASTDSLEARLKENLPDTVRIQILGDLCWNYLSNDLKKSKTYAEQALKLSEKIKHQALLALSYNDLGTVFLREGNYEEAMKLYEKSVVIREKIGLKKEAAATISKIAVINQEKGDYSKAIENNLKALKVFEEFDDKRSLSRLNANIAVLYNNIGNKEKAEEYFDKALKVSIELKDKQSEANIYGAIMGLKETVKDYDAGIESGNRALKIMREINDLSGQGTVLNNIGVFHIYKKNYALADSCFAQSLKIREALSDKKGIASNLKNNGLIYIGVGRVKEAEKCFLNSLEISKDLGIKESMKQNYLYLSELYNSIGEHKKSYDYILQYIEIKDSILNEEKTKQFTELAEKYESEKKEKQIQLLRQEKVVQETLLENKQAEQYLLFLLIAVMILLGFFSYYYIKQRQANQLNRQKNQYQKNLLKSTIEAEEKERKRISEELHDGIVQQLNAIRLMWQNAGFNSEKSVEIMTILNDTTNEVRELSHQMIPRSLSGSGIKEALEDLLNKSFKSSNIKITFDFLGEDAISDDLVKLNIYRVAQELSNNILKHSKANNACFQMVSSKEQLLLIVEDSGRGIDINKQERGLGIMNMKSRLESVGGSIVFEKSPMGGLMTVVKVPLI